MNEDIAYGLAQTNICYCGHRFLASNIDNKQNHNHNRPIYKSFGSSSPELAELHEALKKSQEELGAAEQKIATLNKTLANKNFDLKRLEKKFAQALHFANHDRLTGLPNRSLLLDRLKQAMAQAARQNKQVALLFIDLDKFKSVNDSLGHAAGDKLLQQVAKRLTGCIRYSDTACRYGGDEFIIMLTEMDAQENATQMVEKIRVRLASSYVLGDQVINITASIGVAFYDAEEQNYSELIKKADKAMYVDKALQRVEYA